MRLFLLPLLLAGAAAAHAQQGVYVPMPTEFTPKQSTLVNDVAKAYAQQKEMDASATQFVEVDPGRAPSVVEVTPGVLQFDLGKAPVVVQKPVPAKQSAKAGVPLPDEAAAEAVQSTAPASWRVGLYGASQANQPAAVPASMSLSVPLGRAGATVAVPLAKAAAAASAANAVPAMQVAEPAAAPAVEPPKKTASASSARRLKDWPEVR